MWMWGGGDHGQTGLGKLVDELEPKCAIPSASMSSVKVTMVACGRGERPLAAERSC